MNKQGPTTIDWTDYTWNPIKGCLHGCSYCYLRDIELRFKRDMFTPALKAAALREPISKRRPSFIFAGSAGDSWGSWVHSSWINSMLEVVRDTPRHMFQFLTKNPARYHDFKKLPNAWYGTTVDGLEMTERNIYRLTDAVPEQYTRFVSFEPLLRDVSHQDLTGIDWVIIGADSRQNAAKPKPEWVLSLLKKAREQNIPVWIKENLDWPVRIKEMPHGMQPRHFNQTSKG